MVFCLTGCYFGPEIIEFIFCSASYNKPKKGFSSIGVFQQVLMNVKQKSELLQACLYSVVIFNKFSNTNMCQH
uniref:Putative ovule protein n=1 Tax=Solanum chacoense TaxID=4108 RepID=A0A0V0GXX7_SOLCH